MGNNSKSHAGPEGCPVKLEHKGSTGSGAGEVSRCQDTRLSSSETGTSRCWLQGAGKREITREGKVTNSALRLESAQGHRERSL